jgi:hypothetical protein
MNGKSALRQAQGERLEVFFSENIFLQATVFSKMLLQAITGHYSGWLTRCRHSYVRTIFPHALRKICRKAVNKLLRDAQGRPFPRFAQKLRTGCAGKSLSHDLKHKPIQMAVYYGN